MQNRLSCIKEKNEGVNMNHVKDNPTFATWRLPCQPIITFQSKPRQIIVYSSSMKEDPVTINSTILLPRWKEVYNNCPPMYTKDIVDCDPVKHFIPEFQPCDGRSRSKKISDNFKSKVDSIKDALLFL